MPVNLTQEKPSFILKDPIVERRFDKENIQNQRPFKSSNSPTYEYEESYVKNNLIAYIGNKKRLLDLIVSAIKQAELKGSTPIDRSGSFIDFFSGTGVIARLAKSLGFSVLANDWEPYSYYLNRGFLELDHSDLKLFDSEGGLDRVLNHLNGLKRKGEVTYISKYYCPKNDLKPNLKEERIFYTQQNGILIDNIRTEIDRLYPEGTEENEKKRNLLLALLLVQSSKRSNTSGVFKGFHQGFGGKKQDALTRILSPVKLECPVLSKKKNQVQVFCEDALRLADHLHGQQVEIAYLDPPYNQHQYGSNYHLLNTIAKNDQPKVNEKFLINGKKVNKSAIRKDWKKTRSDFCYQKSALGEFTKLVKRINAKYILISYSDEGVINLEEMVDVLATRGRISAVTSSYVRYRGGRQANTTSNKNIEFVLIIETAFKSSASQVRKVKHLLFSNLLDNLLDDFFPIQNLPPSKVMELDQGYKVFWNQDMELVLDERLHFNQSTKERITKLPIRKKQKFFQELQFFKPQTNYEKVIDIIGLLERTGSINRSYFLNEMVRLYNKVSPQKDPGLFKELTKKILKMNREHGWLFRYGRLLGQFQKIRQSALV